MDSENAWEIFVKSGKVVDYINYKNAVNSVNGNGVNSNYDNNDKGACHQGTNSW